MWLPAICTSRVSPRRERVVRFFLTLNAKNRIKEAQPRSLKSSTEFDVKGESIDEERNEEESARQEEKEVARAASLVYSSTNRPRAIGAGSILAAGFWA
jgi:hypothetical protein